MAVKQVFETYVYDLGMSSVARLPFVMTRINHAHGNACGGLPQQKEFRSSAGRHSTNV